MGWSIDPDLAERVNYKILFCKDCYARAFYKLSSPKPTELNEELMLDQLSALANIEGGLESVIHKQLHHAKAISEEHQVAYVKLLMDMPSRDIYEKTFGSWFQMLLRIGRSFFVGPFKVHFICISYVFNTCKIECILNRLALCKGSCIMTRTGC